MWWHQRSALKRKQRYFFTIYLAMLIMFSSCSSPHQAPSEKVGISWGLPGVGKPSVYGQLNERIVFVCITDISERAQIGVRSDPKEGEVFLATFVRQDGNVVEVKCVAHEEGRRGVFSVDGQRADLLHGRVFLLSMKGENITLKQLAVEMPSAVDLEAVAQRLRRSDEVAEFIKE